MDETYARLVELFQRAQARVTDVVDAVEAGQWDDVTPAGLTVEQLVEHLVAGGRQGGTEMLGGAPLLAWEDAADQALTGWALLAPGEQESAGPQLRRQTAELTLHAFDLGRATGTDHALDDDLVRSALDVVDQGPWPPVGCPVPPSPTTAPGASVSLALLLVRTGRLAAAPSSG